MSASPRIFDGPGGDIILRAPLELGSDESKDFHVHKIILSVASTVFQDAFSIPQPPHPTSELKNTTLDVVPVTEPAVVLETFLQFIYPVDPPVVESLRLLGALFQIADKYQATGVTTKLKHILVSPGGPGWSLLHSLSP